MDSVIGLDIESVVEKFISCRQGKFLVPEKGTCIYCGVILDIDDATNKLKSIERVRYILGSKE